MNNRKAKILIAQRWNGGKAVDLRVSNKRYGLFIFDRDFVFKTLYTETYAWKRRVNKRSPMSSHMFKIGGW